MIEEDYDDTEDILNYGSALALSTFAHTYVTVHYPNSEVLKDMLDTAEMHRNSVLDEGLKERLTNYMESALVRSLAAQKPLTLVN